ncbi:MAG: hypothetical protein AAF478_10815 [Pseudomonadota bacterium]
MAAVRLEFDRADAKIFDTREPGLPIAEIIFHNDAENRNVGRVTFWEDSSFVNDSQLHEDLNSNLTISMTYLSVRLDSVLKLLHKQKTGRAIAIDAQPPGAGNSVDGRAYIGVKDY